MIRMKRNLLVILISIVKSLFIEIIIQSTTCKYCQTFTSRCTLKMNGFCPKRRKGFKIRFCVGNCTECKTYCNKCWCMCIITPQEKFRGTIHTTHTLSFDINLAQRENNFSVLKYKYYIKIKWTNLSFFTSKFRLIRPKHFGTCYIYIVIWVYVKSK